MFLSPPFEHVGSALPLTAVAYRGAYREGAYVVAEVRDQVQDARHAVAVGVAMPIRSRRCPDPPTERSPPRSYTDGHSFEKPVKHFFGRPVRASITLKYKRYLTKI